MTTTDQFQKLWDAGYHRLVPVVPPKAELHEKSSLHMRLAAGDDSRGKAPGIMRDDGKWRGIQFVAMESHENDLNVWGGMGASVGVKLGQGLVALDIDTTDRPSAERLYTLAAEILGPAAVRFGRRPKCLMLYEAPEDTAYQQVVFSTPTEDAARVELLAEGRQFVAQGIHPATGEPYAWPNGIPRRDQLTRITAEQLERFMQEAHATLPKARRQQEHKDRDAPEQETLKAPSWDALKDLVDQLPNTSALFPEREDYVRIAYAVKAATPEGYELEALELYLDWCERWDGGENDPDVAYADWHRAKPPFRVGFDHLRSFAGYSLLAPVDAKEIEAKTALDDMFATAPEQRAKGLRLLALDEVFDLPDPKFLIGRHIPETGFGILFGDPGAGKSFVALDMALHLAFGLSAYHGDPITPRHEGRVLYIAGEGASGFRARARAWISHNLSPDQAHRQPNIRFLFQAINFMRPEDVKELTEAVQAIEFDHLDLIVVDTVSRAIPGADENLQKDMTTFVAACDALRIQTGAFVLGIHHTAKSGDMRGSSVFSGQADAVFKFERNKGAPVGRLICTKQKDAPDGWKDPYRLTEVALPDGTSSLVPERVDASTEAEGSHMDHATQQAILDAMQAAWEDGKPWSDKPQSKGRFVGRVASEKFSVPTVAVLACLDLWVQEGLVEVREYDKRNGLKGLFVVGQDVRKEGDDLSASVFG